MLHQTTLFQDMTSSTFFFTQNLHDTRLWLYQIFSQCPSQSLFAWPPYPTGSLHNSPSRNNHPLDNTLETASSVWTMLLFLSHFLVYFFSYKDAQIQQRVTLKDQQDLSPPAVHLSVASSLLGRHGFIYQRRHPTALRHTCLIPLQRLHPLDHPSRRHTDNGLRPFCHQSCANTVRLFLQGPCRNETTCLLPAGPRNCTHHHHFFPVKGTSHLYPRTPKQST